MNYNTFFFAVIFCHIILTFDHFLKVPLLIKQNNFFVTLKLHLCYHIYNVTL